ncbi:hypothetical protein [Niveibacterium sp. SC-1]|uniref:hypothetical protein n=1 Tax=Niveibacterium sp. SC-1 TaxID=3135646 RepID=UPI00311DBE3A
MESFLEYKGFLIEPLVYPLAPGADKKRRTPLDMRYQAAVRVTDFNGADPAVVKVQADFGSFGDARRAAEVFGRELIDAPTARKKPARAATPKAKKRSDAT